MATARQIIKQWFSNFKKPTQEQFWAWIDSFVHKDDKIPMQQVEGLETALQSVPTSDQFNNHINDGNAHQTLFAQKVDKEEGKGLSANDYSDEEKQKVHDTADKVIVSGSVTGDVNKILTLTYSDSTTLKIPFKDLGIENVADIMLNSLNFNHETGVLTGVRSDGQQLTVNLDGRYALIGHTHSYNDLEDLPTLLPEAPSDGKEYLRQNKLWKAFTGWQFRELGLENLNDIKTAGFYGKYTSDEATAARNYPYNAIRGGHLLVLPMTTNAGTLTLFQVYFAAGTQHSGNYTDNARIFMRAFVNNSQWLPWREFDGGKIHNLTETVQNLASAFQDKFPTNGSTFVVNQATTITVANATQVVTYVKNTADNLTFEPVSGVDIIGDKVITAPVGTLVHLICSGETAFVCYHKPQSQQNQVIDFIDALPQTTTPNAHYYRKNPNGKVDAFVTDNDNILKALNSDIPENLFRRSSAFSTLFSAPNSSGGYVVVRQWNATPVIYGQLSNSEWGVFSRSISLENNAGGMTTKNLVNKEITVSVNVKIVDDIAGENYTDGVDGIEVGLGYTMDDPRPFLVKKSDGWVRISTTVKNNRVPSIIAKFRSPEKAGFAKAALTSALYFDDWKISEQKGDVFYVPSWSDAKDGEVHYVKTYRMRNADNFSTEDLVEGQIQDGKHIGLSAQNTTLTINSYRSCYKTRYVFLRDNSRLTVVTNAPHYLSNSTESNNKVFAGNRGDYVDVEYVLDERNQPMAMAMLTRLSGNASAPANSSNNIVVFNATRSTLNLSEAHAGKTVVVTDMTRNITLDTSGFPDNAECSVIKLTDGYQINITPSPAKGLPIKGRAMSSAYLVKVNGAVYIKNDNS